MSHELTITNGEAEMFYYGEKPWHGLGTEVLQALTAYEAIHAAKLHWPVEKRPIWFMGMKGLVEANNILDASGREMNVMVRADNDLPLGVVGKDYVPIQNHEAFAFMDSVVQDASAKYHTAGSLRGGRVIWILMKLPSHIVVGKNDLVDKYLLMMNRHDGTGKAICKFTATRVVCQNTLSLAMREAQTTVSIVHTGNMEKKVSQARKVLGLANEFFMDLDQVFDLMYTTKINDSALDVYLNEVFTKDTEYADAEIEVCKNLYHKGAGHEMAIGTLWGAYSAVTEYVDHHRLSGYLESPAKQDQYLNSVMVGSGATIKSKAYTAATALIG